MQITYLINLSINSIKIYICVYMYVYIGMYRTFGISKRSVHKYIHPYIYTRYIYIHVYTYNDLNTNNKQFNQVCYLHVLTQANIILLG